MVEEHLSQAGAEILNNENIRQKYNNEIILSNENITKFFKHFLAFELHLGTNFEDDGIRIRNSRILAQICPNSSQ